MSERHACPTCQTKHSEPKASNVMRGLAWGVAITAAEVPMALVLDGWMRWALWAIIARNVVITIALVWGLAQIAEGRLGADS